MAFGASFLNADRRGFTPLIGGASADKRRQKISGNLYRLSDILMLNKIKIFKYIFIFSIIAIFSLLIYYSYQQYIAWQSVEPSKYLLPPYASLNYFIQYVGFRFFGPYLISLTTSLLLLFSLNRLNKKYEEKFFYPEEPPLAALAMFLAGWPGALFYFVGLILIYLIIHFLISIYYKFFLRFDLNEIRVSLRHWWIPTAIIVIIINRWLMELGLWKLLKI